jgi:RNA recognition motif-containing protein
VRIFVGNLSFRATEDEVRQAFEIHGQVERVILPPSLFHEGENRGYAIVVMPDIVEANSALQGMNGALICGRAVRVEEAKPAKFREH